MSSKATDKMAERVAQRAKKATDAKRSPRERLAMLPLKQEDAALGEAQEFYTHHWAVAVRVVREFLAALDSASDGDTARKAAPMADVVSVCAVLRMLTVLAAPTVALDPRAEILGFVEQELHCLLHSENHAAVRQLGFDVLLEWYTAMRPHDAAPKLMVRPHVSLLLSSLDWDFFRVGHTGVVLPTTIVELRKARHRCYPPRTRSAISADDTRGRHALLMVEHLFAFGLQGPLAQRQHWWAFFMEHLGPILYPQEFFEAGATSRQLLEGFCQGLPPALHRCVVVYLCKAAEDTAAAGSLWAAELDLKVVLFALLVSPTVVTTTQDTTTILRALQTVQRWLDGDAPPHFEAVVQEVLTVVLQDDRITACAELLHSDDGALEGADGPLGEALQHQVEHLARFLLNVVATARFTDEVRREALAQLGRAVHRLSPPAPGLLAGTPLVNVCCLFWHGVVVFAPPLTPRFGDFVRRTSLALQASVPEHDAGGMPPFFFQLWLSLLRRAAVCVIDPTCDYEWPELVAAVASPAPTTAGLAALRGECRRLNIDAALRAPALDGDMPFALFDAFLHESMVQLPEDRAAVRRAKCLALCDCVMTLLDGLHRREAYLEPTNLLKLVAPYLLVAATTFPDPARHTDVELVALETIAALLTAVSATQTRLEPTLTAGILNLLSHALCDVHRLTHVELCRRVLPLLFPAAGECREGFFEAHLFGARAFEHTLFGACDRILAEDPTAANAEAQSAALTGKMWQLHFARLDGHGSAAEAAKAVLDTVDAFVARGTTVVCRAKASTLLLQAALWCLEDTGAVSEDARWEAAQSALRLLSGLCTSLDPAVVHAATSAVTTLIDAACVVASAGGGRAHRLRAMATTALPLLCAPVLFHLRTGGATAAGVPAILELLAAVRAAALKLGGLDGPLPCSDGAPLAQLVCDTASYCRTGETRWTYAMHAVATTEPIQLVAVADAALCGSDAATVVPAPQGDPAWFAPLLSDAKAEAHALVHTVWAEAEVLFQALQLDVGLFPWPGSPSRDAMCRTVPPEPLLQYRRGGQEHPTSFSFGTGPAHGITITQLNRRELHVASVQPAGVGSWRCEMLTRDEPAPPPPPSRPPEPHVRGTPEPNTVLDQLLEEHHWGLAAAEDESATQAPPAPELLTPPPAAAPAPYAVPPVGENSGTAATMALLSGLGYTSTDPASALRPLSGAIKPQRCGIPLPHLPAATLPHPRRLHHVSIAPIDGGTAAQCAAIAATLGQSTGAGEWRWREAGAEYVATVLPPGLPQAHAAPAPARLHVAVASGVSAVAVVRGRMLRSLQGPGRPEAPIAVVLLTPAAFAPQSWVVHAVASRGVSTAPVAEGAPCAAAALPFLLRAVARSVGAAHRCPVRTRQEALRTAVFRATEKDSFAQLLLPLLASPDDAQAPAAAPAPVEPQASETPQRPSPTAASPGDDGPPKSSAD